MAPLKHDLDSDGFYALRIFMIGNARRDAVISQHVEVALVYKEMLGLDEAKRYLERERVPYDIVERVIAPGPRQVHARRRVECL